MGARPLPSLVVTSEQSRPVVLAIQNDPTDPPLMVGEWLDEAGIQVDVVAACDGSPVPPAVPSGVSGVLVLGGSMGANDHAQAPWLEAEKALLRDATDRAVPVLGLCLGGQVLAEATGGQVTLAPTTEIGLAFVRRTPQGAADPVMGAVAALADGRIPAAQWHQDHVAQLPPGAELLLTNDACVVQGYRVGTSSYGLQLHPEINGDVFRWWAGYVDEALERSGADPLTAADEVAAYDERLVAAWRPFTHAWAQLVFECQVQSARVQA